MSTTDRRDKHLHSALYCCCKEADMQISCDGHICGSHGMLTWNPDNVYKHWTGPCRKARPVSLHFLSAWRLPLD